MRAKPCGRYLELRTNTRKRNCKMVLKCGCLLTLTHEHVLQYACVIKAQSSSCHTPVKEAAWDYGWLKSTKSWAEDFAAPGEGVWDGVCSWGGIEWGCPQTYPIHSDRGEIGISLQSFSFFSGLRFIRVWSFHKGKTIMKHQKARITKAPSKSSRVSSVNDQAGSLFFEGVLQSVKIVYRSLSLLF